MFRDPPRWATFMQFNFLLQRGIAVTDALSDGGFDVLVAERCIAEDSLFFGYYRATGDIPDAVVEAYEGLHKHLVERIPAPDVIVHLRAEPELLYGRLRDAFLTGQRPAELSGDPLQKYVVSMNKIYDEWAKRASKLCAHYKEYRVQNDLGKLDELVNEVCGIIENRRRGQE